MFPREKFAKSNQFFTNQNTSKNNISSSKYFQKPFYKNQKQNSKKYKCNQLWKKTSSFHWSEKENDKNNSNYQYNKKFHFEGRKTFHYHKKISKTKFDYNFNYSEEEAKNQKNEYENKIIEDCGLSKENSKDEKNNSIEYNTNTTTTAYSHSKSTSAHDELSINNGGNGNNSENLNLNSNQNTINNNINNSKKKPKKQKKKKSISSELKKSFSDNINEPYNKYNSINNELISQTINPLVENTEILKIKVKIEKDKYLLFKLRRFDDLFLTVKLFCEINNIEEKLIKPIITMVLCGLNSIYQIYNTQMEMDNIKILRLVRSYSDIDL